MLSPITPTDPLSQSAEIIPENIAALQTLFPEAFTEGKIDFEVLKQLLGGQIDEREEKYGLNWNGKRRARQIALTPSLGTLRPCPEESVDWDTTQNIFIEGDNLEVLKLLQKSYAGRVKMIYIDPPYNTGKDFVYPDNFQNNIQNYLELTGQVDGEGRKLSSNSETSGRYHTDWLNMMYPRLKLAWNLLREDGVIFMSIDDKEKSNLISLCNEIFGEDRFVASITAVTNLKGRNDKKHVAACHEYILIYSKSEFESNGLPLTEKQKQTYKYQDELGRRFLYRDLRKRGGPDRRKDRPNMFFPIYWNPSTNTNSMERTSEEDIEAIPLLGDGSEGRWKWGKEKVKKYLDFLHVRKSERSSKFDVEYRFYLDPNVGPDEDDQEDSDLEEDDEIERTNKPKSIWIGGEFSSDSGRRALKELMPGKAFDYPKSLDLIGNCITLGASKDEIILDFFGGSGTTGHAILEQNSIDGNSRRYIMVQLPEPIDPEKKDQKPSFDFCLSLGKNTTIAEITKERLRRAGKKVKADNPLFSGDTGFRVFKLDSSNIKTWDPDRAHITQNLLDAADNIKEDRDEQDVLYEVLLKLGLDLCIPMQTRQIADCTVSCIGAGTLFVCLDWKIDRDKALALGLGLIAWRQELQPAVQSSFVFRDSGFVNDVAKTNLVTTLEQSLGNDVLSIRSI